MFPVISCGIGSPIVFRIDGAISDSSPSYTLYFLSHTMNGTGFVV